jgi:site-specific recombinase XerD
LSGFAEWLSTQGYSRKAMRGHVLRLRQALERTRSFSPEVQSSSKQFSKLFAFPTRQAQYRATEHNFRRYLTACGRLSPQPEPEFGRFTPLLDAYRRHLLDMRGLAMETTRHHLNTAWAFLNHAVEPASGISTICAQAVESFVIAAGQRMKRTTLQQPVAQLRSFLRFCYNCGEVPARLDGTDTPRVYEGELPPRALPWKLTLAFLDTIDRTETAGCRDHLILYLMACFGLRPSEVASLDLKSINWASWTLRVEQRKTRSSLVLPLPAPAQAMTSTSIRSIHRRRARQSGLPLDATSSYSLRHGFAMRLLDCGVGIKAVGDLFGHRTVQGTQVYLRLQTESLREVGLSLPCFSHDRVGTA